MICRGCFKEGGRAPFCNRCRRELWDGKKTIVTSLDFDKKEFISLRNAFADHLSISGMQDKISIRLVKDRLVPTDRDGEYILKPVPENSFLERVGDIPANEQASMRLAELFAITVAPCTLVTFGDGEPAYLVRRFDRVGGKKLAQEDFCQLSNRTEETHGRNYKYDGTCEEMGEIVFRYCAAGRIEIEKLYRQIVFCYMIANGDAHLKNFSLIEGPFGDFILSPAYDLMATAIHLPGESRMALDLFKQYASESYERNGFHTGYDFLMLADRFGIKRSSALHYLSSFFEKKEPALALIGKSSMSEEGKRLYADLYLDRLRAIQVDLDRE